MDQEILDRKLLGLSTKEDLEKLRQEMKSNFRQLKEENKNQILEWRQEVKADFEQLRKEGKVEIDPIRKEFDEEIGRLRIEMKSALDQSFQKLDSFLHQVREERGTLLAYAGAEVRTDFDGVKNRMEGLREGVRQITEEIVSVREKMKEGFIDVKEELGSMIKFSYADLEKRLAALEARIKALEKMVFP
jgi:exonuclease VII large subunit